MSAVRERSNPAFAYLQHATIVDASDEIVTLSVAKKHFLESLSEPGMSALVAEAIEHVSGVRPRISLVLGAAPQRTANANADTSAFALAESVLGTELI